MMEQESLESLLALVIRSQLLKNLDGLMEAEQMTLRKVLTELDKVKFRDAVTAVTVR